MDYNMIKLAVELKDKSGYEYVEYSDVRAVFTYLNLSVEKTFVKIEKDYDKVLKSLITKKRNYDKKIQVKKTILPDEYENILGKIYEYTGEMLEWEYNEKYGQYRFSRNNKKELFFGYSSLCDFLKVGKIIPNLKKNFGDKIAEHGGEIRYDIYLSWVKVITPFCDLKIQPNGYIKQMNELMDYVEAGKRAGLDLGNYKSPKDHYYTYKGKRVERLQYQDIMNFSDEYLGRIIKPDIECEYSSMKEDEQKYSNLRKNYDELKDKLDKVEATLKEMENDYMYLKFDK